MNLIVEPQIFEQFPDTLLGVVVLHDINNKGDDASIGQLLRDAEKKAIENLGSTLIIEHPNIAPWREVYRKFGAKPKDYPSSIENLLRRISKGESVRHINKMVDIYNVISLKYFVPVGGEDLSKIQGNVLLTIAGENEKPILLLGEHEERPPYPKEVIYKDEIGTICRRWNWKEADRTKLTEETTDALMVIEGMLPIDKGIIQKAIADLAELIQKYCGGEIKSYILDTDNVTADL